MQSVLDAISKYEQHTELFTAYTNELRNRSKEMYPLKLQELCDRRKFSMDTVEKAGVIYIGDKRELVIPEYMNNLVEFGLIAEHNNWPIYQDRYVIPIKDEKGKTINFVGYTWNADERYLYGKGKYYIRRDDFYGMEEMDSIYEDGYCILVEGITDRIALKNIGIKNVLASCGTVDSKKKMSMLARLKYGVIFIHDRDKAGDETRKHWVVPRAVRLNIADGSKDIDGYLNKAESEEERAERKLEALQSIEDCVTWLKQGKCNISDLNKHSIESYTMY